MSDKKSKKIYIFETPYDRHGLSEVLVIANNLEEAVEKVVKRLTDGSIISDAILPAFMDDYKKAVLRFFEGNKIPTYKIVEDLDDFFYFNIGCDCD